MPQLVQEVWTPEIMAQLFQNSEFVTLSEDYSSNVKGEGGAGVVRIPQGGAAPEMGGITKDSTTNTTALGVTEYEVTDLQFNIELYFTKPTLITQFQEAQQSSELRKTIVNQHGGVLNQAMGTHFLNKAVAPATLTDANSVEYTAEEGLKKAISKAITKLQKQNIQLDGRVYGILSADMQAELFEVPEYINAFNLGQTVLGAYKLVQFMGITWITRPTTVLYKADKSLRAVDRAGKHVGSATTDRDAILIWHRDSVGRAVSKPKVNAIFDHPQFNGDVMNMNYFMGFTKRYADERGIVAILKAAAV